MQEPYKTFILNWEKTFEWRLNKWKFAEMQVWDILEFENTKEKFEIISKNIFIIIFIFEFFKSKKYVNFLKSFIYAKINKKKKK